MTNVKSIKESSHVAVVVIYLMTLSVLRLHRADVRMINEYVVAGRKRTGEGSQSI
jgi:hypothetical protein